MFAAIPFTPRLFHEMFAVAVIALIIVSSSHAFPTGAGGCPANQAAVAGSHLRDGGVLPTFAEQGYEFIVDGVPVNDAVIPTVVWGNTYEIGVRSTMNEFRGALIRVQGSTIVAEEGENSKLADNVCGEVPAVTHTDASLKTILTGSFTVPPIALSGPIVVDVTVVERNGVESIYSYQQFFLDSVEGETETENALIRFFLNLIPILELILRIFTG